MGFYVLFFSVVLCLGNGFLLNFIQLSFVLDLLLLKRDRNVVDGVLIYRIMY